jgi:heterodisulfide reductase subunit A
MSSEHPDITPVALVIGGGIAGIQAALDIAASGHEVLLVEREPSIGGHMVQLAETFPTLDCPQCILTPKMVEAGQHEKITILAYAEVERVRGQAGNFFVTIRRKAAYIDWEACTGCGRCSEKCPAQVPAPFDRFLGTRPAVYTPFPQAVPNKPVIDRPACIYFQKGTCAICEKFCDAEAIRWDQEEERIERTVGAIVVATGYDLYPITRLGEYGGGRIADVIDSLAFERLLAASGPTAGTVRRPSDGTVPQHVVFVQCAGSRNPEQHLPHCSKVCCMYATKQVMLYKRRVPDGRASVFAIDVRTGGKGYDEFYRRTTAEEGVTFYRGKVSKVYQEDGRVIVWGADTLSGRKVAIAADLVVLAMGMVPSEGTGELVKTLKIPVSPTGFLTEADVKLRPVESPVAGCYVAGCAQGPRDIPETVAQASAAAAKVVGFFARSRGGDTRQRKDGCYGSGHTRRRSNGS